ncbi:hypothetical protein MKW98_013026 [Papaver atlanticum]|uniref:Poly [ADP-ribose] polymerase n=1 Tax=Papaver atlanticum TaxID=357466 RepID=A0AAD4XH42_9MAGN|nr:hypothetical protein MKW98_013026 [Papaver atlanticum]
MIKTASLRPKIVDFSSSKDMMMMNKQRNSVRSTGRKFTNKTKSSIVDYTDSNFRSSPNNGDEQCGFCSTQALIQNYTNFKQSDVPVRFMYYNNGTWIGFSKDVFEVLKEGFIGNKPVVEVSIDGAKYLVDFLRMLQIDLVSGNRRSVSWIDVENKCFFPKFTVEEKSDDCCEVVEFPTSKIEIKIDSNSSKNLSKRKRMNHSHVEDAESDTESSSDDQHSAVKRARVLSVVMEKGKWPNVEVLEDEEKNYIDIKNIFLSGLRKVHRDVSITAIRRCLHAGPVGVARLQAFQRQMELTKAARGGTSDVRLAWHGTSSESIANIILHGFGLDNKPSDSEAAYGDGVYLSPARSPETSAILSEADKNGEKHVLLCRVIMGNIEKVELGSDQCHPSNANFDTGVDNLANPRWYIVWGCHMRKHILPEYIVSYKSSPDHQQGLPTGTPILKRDNTPSSTMSFPRLFAAMKSSLPISSIQELESLYGLFKDGRVPKDVLIRQLRSIAGDQLITSTVHKIRSSIN